MAVTEQEDLCRQNRKSFFSSSVFLIFFPATIFFEIGAVAATFPTLSLSLSLCLGLFLRVYVYL